MQTYFAGTQASNKFGLCLARLELVHLEFTIFSFIRLGLADRFTTLWFLTPYLKLK